MTAPLWTSAEAIEATNGTAAAAWEAAGVSIDSRTVKPGDLFVAIVGPNMDGHDFVADALKKGAAAALIDHRPDGLPDDAPLLLAGDTLEALRDLGRAARARTSARIVAVTGSVGKTGTKEALKLVLSGQGSCHANEGSLNNHWGLPLSLARLPAGADFGVFEIGMNHPDEITPLSEMARPHVAVITTIEAVHSAHFADEEEIAAAKAEIFDGMSPGGVAVLNRDNRHFEYLAARAEEKGLTAIGFGTHEQADARIAHMALDADGTDVDAVIGDTKLSFRVGAPGRHWVMNAMAVLAAVSAVGADVARAARDLGALRPPKGRGERHRVPLVDGELLVIDESYNASPVSMTAAFETLGRLHPTDGGRRIVVLGDMLELGETTVERHAGLAGPLTENGIDLVYTAGPLMAYLFDALPKAMRGGHASDSKALAPIVTGAVRAGDAVMVKGSAGSRMGGIVEALRALSATGQTTHRAVNGD